MNGNGQATTPKDAFEDDDRFIREVEAEAGIEPAMSFGELRAAHPKLRDSVVYGLLRRGETMNIIAPPKVGKSWLVYDFALSLCLGFPWLNRFQTTAGRVLIIDNELHPETIAHRIPLVAQARGFEPSAYADRLFVHSLRGRIKDLYQLGGFFERQRLERWDVVIIDAWYRCLPADVDENANGEVAQLFNCLDHYASITGAAFVQIHHSSKGNQSDKSIVDVGAGAGSQARATDTHLVLRQHEQQGVVVLDGAARSWPPPDPLCLGWTFPVWNVETGLDPSKLLIGRRRKAAEPEEPKVVWTTEIFVERYVTAEPKSKSAIQVEAKATGDLSGRASAQLIEAAESEGKIHRWTFGRNKPLCYATIEQTLTQDKGVCQ
jgi:hypothetical protein